MDLLFNTSYLYAFTTTSLGKITTYVWSKVLSLSLQKA